MMRHKDFYKKLNRSSSHRRALLKNMTKNVFEHKSIKTTKSKMDVILSFASRFITRLLKQENDRNAIMVIKSQVTGTDKVATQNILDFYRNNKESKKTHFFSKEKIQLCANSNTLFNLMLVT